MNRLNDLDNLKKAIRNIPDFPRKGIQFKDITTAIKQHEIFNFVIEHISEHYSEKAITKVVAIESRGFITGGALAYKLGAGFVPVRKPGKLPAPAYSKTYDLEYGKDSLEIHKDALDHHDIVLIHDDLLATGGTVLAVIDLIKYFNIKQVFISFIVELDFLKGRQRLSPPYDIYTMVHF
jgi:adenine phosphoribosyltransferase